MAPLPRCVLRLFLAPGRGQTNLRTRFRKFSPGTTSSTAAPPTRASTASPYRPSLRGPIPAMAISSSVRPGLPLGQRGQRGVGEDHVRRDLLRAGHPLPATRRSRSYSSSSMSDGQVGQRPSLRSAPASRVAPQIRQETTWVRRRARSAGSPRRRPARSAPPERSSCGRNRDGRRARPPGERAAAYDSQSHCRARVMPDVEQPPLLLDLLGGLRVRGGQGALGEADQEDRVPLQALGRVQARPGSPRRPWARAAGRPGGPARR